jgi:hypothetical protein
MRETASHDLYAAIRAGEREVSEDVESSLAALSPARIAAHKSSLAASKWLFS